MFKVLIIDDEEDILNLLEDGLSDEYEVTTTLDPLKVCDIIQSKAIDLVLLDINMPKLNGYQLGAQIRSLKGCENLPLIFLTGQDDTFSRTACYQVGGDNFISKPFKLSEIKAIIEHLLKKNSSKVQTILSYGDISMNLITYQCFIQGVSVELPNKEYQILLYFIQHPEQVVSRETLLGKAWKDNLKVSDRTVDTHISNLRKKIQTSLCKVKSIYQEGYIFSK